MAVLAESYPCFKLRWVGVMCNHIVCMVVNQINPKCGLRVECVVCGK